MNVIIKNIFIALTFFCAIWQLRAGDEVNNGAGLAEKNVLFAYHNLNKYIRLCLSSQSCATNDRERALLRQIASSLSMEYRNRQQLVFLSEKENPGTFIIDNEVKMAKTGNSVGSPIYINKDFLYLKNDLGIYEALSISQAVAILVHELGHHQTATSENIETELYVIGNKVSMIISKRFLVSSLFPYSDDISIAVFNEKKKNSFPQILLYAYDDMVDISELFKNALSCPLFSLPAPVESLPDFNISTGKKPTGATFHNMSWITNFKIFTGTKRGRFVVKGHLSNDCDKESNIFNNNKNYSARITFDLDNLTTKNEGPAQVSIIKESIEIKQFYNPWWRLLQLPSAHVSSSTH
ncbi:MAG: hypothetical protein A2504_10920 [Bdellovibrionales bacterium RIFOXYD12_FULL_39_22]|nr:MAG: hypothetical protein A2385_09485 [Bdellovibrionales bacterium RIFOXYB1_FULL_39_21]OFZ44191.1 MAG: hypothetical protein A2485_07105 [Bdellovibrionales bacterium RIFOXYC12_FULL_39_17]OFZ46733.1 MAG: hypothetical protein A2404_04340 [Bdellovibrionales bacterium RIFOXYC1_FULL_39_130]OFZ74102.1 MAG: hypothetical protein A2451_11215 [Bdellovibrionales bacterium RIFOXYC2_FULL_39_8]OFZ75990.1 MAG: hypothetical protein A2560_02810 [Bdellovibrionales bacterium RIFOXYD1_FULL_39_84]OFZ95413.1 MAG: